MEEKFNSLIVIDIISNGISFRAVKCEKCVKIAIYKIFISIGCIIIIIYKQNIQYNK